MIWILVLFCLSGAEFKFLNEFFTRHGEIDSLFKKLEPLDLISYDTGSVLYLTKDELKSNKYEIVKFGPFQMACEHDVKANPKFVEKEKLSLDFLIKLFAIQQLFTCTEIQSLSTVKVAALCTGKSLKLTDLKNISDDTLAAVYSYDSDLTKINSEQIKTYYVNSGGEYSSIEYNCSQYPEYMIEKFATHNFFVRIWHPVFCAKPTIDELINSIEKFILKFSLNDKEAAYYSIQSRKLLLVGPQYEPNERNGNDKDLNNASTVEGLYKSLGLALEMFLSNMESSKISSSDVNIYKIEKIPYRLLSKNTSFGNFHRAIESLGVKTVLAPTGKYKHIEVWQYCPTNYGKSMYPEVSSKIISDNSIEILISNPLLCAVEQLREERQTNKLIRFSICKRVRYKYDHARSNLARDVPKSFSNETLYQYNLLPVNFVERKIF